MISRSLDRSKGGVIPLTGFALLMFALNSLLCRMALRTGSIDAASFSTIRLLSGAVMLLVIMVVTDRRRLRDAGDWRSALFLFLYAVPFSFAYTGLSTGTGALILFGAVQITMLLSAWISGERPSAIRWIGLALAVAGLVYLLLPGLQAPPILPAIWMAIAGTAWGLYSIRGRGAGDPLVRTYGNFLRSVPMVLVVSLITLPMMQLSTKGVLLAVLSGAGASAIGYVAWYGALKHLGGMQASVLQLLVPVIAATAGVIVLAEVVSLRLVFASLLVIGGVALAILLKGGKTS